MLGRTTYKTLLAMVNGLNMDLCDRRMYRVIVTALAGGRYQVTAAFSEPGRAEDVLGTNLSARETRTMLNGIYIGLMFNHANAGRHRDVTL